MKIGIPQDLIKTYFDYFISEYLDEHSDLPSNPVEFDAYLGNLKIYLLENHEQNYFASGLKLLLDNPGTNYQDYYAYDYPLDDNEIREIMVYLYKAITPKDDGNNDIIINNESLEEFRIKQGMLHKISKGETLRSIADKYKMEINLIRKANPYWYDNFKDTGLLEEGKTVKLRLRDTWH